MIGKKEMKDEKGLVVNYPNGNITLQATSDIVRTTLNGVCFIYQVAR